MAKKKIIFYQLICRHLMQPDNNLSSDELFNLFNNMFESGKVYRLDEEDVIYTMLIQDNYIFSSIGKLSKISKHKLQLLFDNEKNEVIDSERLKQIRIDYLSYFYLDCNSLRMAVLKNKSGPKIEEIIPLIIQRKNTNYEVFVYHEQHPTSLDYLKRFTTMCSINYAFAVDNNSKEFSSINTIKALQSDVENVSVQMKIKKTANKNRILDVINSDGDVKTREQFSKFTLEAEGDGFEEVVDLLKENIAKTVFVDIPDNILEDENQIAETLKDLLTRH